jgi:hypothetical protein
MQRLITVIALASLVSAAFAHSPHTGANGGKVVDAGDYHVEMITKDKALNVYLHDRDNKPVEAKGHKAVGIFVVAGKSQRIELTPESANKLTGTAPVALPATPKGAVQITLPSGSVVQAKFE